MKQDLFRINTNWFDSVGPEKGGVVLLNTLSGWERDYNSWDKESDEMKVMFPTWEDFKSILIVSTL